MNFIEMEKLLNELKDLYKNEKIEKEKTFLEIARIAHQEVVISNILAFYLDINEEHELGDALLASLLESAEIEIEKPIMEVSIEREYRTKKGNFIDLIIQTDEFVLGIENKIYSSVYNDLSDYAETIESINPKAYKILLSLSEETESAQKANFINVTYKMLLNNLKTKFGTIMKYENKWHVYMGDFIKNIENLYNERKIIMNQEVQEWVNQNQEEINYMYKFLMELKMEMNEKTTKMKNILEELIANYEFVDYIWIWNKNGVQDENLKLFTICVIEMKKYKMAIDNYIGPEGWKIDIVFRGKNGYESMKNKLSNDLTARNINHYSVDINHLRIEELKYDVEYEKIVEKDRDLLEIIKEMYK